MAEMAALSSITLADTGRRTSRLGFGCSGLMGGIGERESLRLLDAAYDAGIRHFDVAPSYGHGAAEGCLGRFLRSKEAEITVTTKYGILPPRQAGILRVAREILRPIARQFPFARRKMARAAAGLKTRGRFSVAEAQASLERSLRELGVERLDIWLLHEATVEDLGDGALLEFLQRQVKGGRIGAFGVGSAGGRIPAIWDERPEYCRVLQMEWPGFSAGTDVYGGAFLMHHRVVQEYCGRIAALLARDGNLQKTWSDAVGLDLSERQNVAAMLLKTALLVHPERIVLFSSRNPAHIASNVRMAQDAGWDELALRFRELVLQMETGFAGKDEIAG